MKIVSVLRLRRALRTRARAAGGASSSCRLTVGTQNSMLNTPETAISSTAGQKDSCATAIIETLVRTRPRRMHRPLPSIATT